MLLNFCKANGLRILNGRSGNDLDGNFTFIGRQGSSTIDFGIVSEHLLDQVSDFRVGSRIESAHFPIELAITKKLSFIETHQRVLIKNCIKK